MQWLYISFGGGLSFSPGAKPNQAKPRTTSSCTSTVSSMCYTFLQFTYVWIPCGNGGGKSERK